MCVWVYAADLQCLFVLHCIPGSQRAQAAGEASLGFVLTANIKPHLNGSRPSQTPTRPSLMGLPPTPVSRLPRKTLGPSRSHTEASVHTELSEGAGSTQGEPSNDLIIFSSRIFCPYRLLHKGIKSDLFRLCPGSDHGVHCAF